MLSEQELARADRFHFSADRDAFIAAHALERFMLSEATGVSTSAWHYVSGEFGKPELAADVSECRLRFNVSHTRGLVACAIAYQDVGVDVERSDRAVDLGMARRYFAPEEVLNLISAPVTQRVQIFFRIWSLKEAFIKTTGEGLSRPLDSFSFCFEPVRVAFHAERNNRPVRDDPAEWRFWEFVPAEDCVGALAVRSTRLDCNRLDSAPANAADIGPL